MTIQPQVLNIICPPCRKAWLIKGEGHYTCPACNYVLIERVAHEYISLIEGDIHKGIYLPDAYRPSLERRLHPVYIAVMDKVNRDLVFIIKGILKDLVKWVRS